MGATLVYNECPVPKLVSILQRAPRVQASEFQRDTSNSMILVWSLDLTFLTNCRELHWSNSWRRNASESPH